MKEFALGISVIFMCGYCLCLAFDSITLIQDWYYYYYIVIYCTCYSLYRSVPVQKLLTAWICELGSKFIHFVMYYMKYSLIESIAWDPSNQSFLGEKNYCTSHSHLPLELLLDVLAHTWLTSVTSGPSHVGILWPNTDVPWTKPVYVKIVPPPCCG